MDIFPVFFRMDDAQVAVFGGGEEARRKTRLLARTPAEILVFAETPDPAFRAEFEGRVRWLAPGDAGRHLPACRFAIIAEPDEAAAMAAFAAARQAGLPVNRVDHRAFCDFTVPSILDRGRLTVGVATGGAAPVLARDVRGTLETLLPPALGDLVELSAGLRAAVRIAFADATGRRRFWEAFFQGEVAGRWLAGDRAGAEAALEALFAGAGKDGAVKAGAGKAVATPRQVQILTPPDGPADRISLRAFRALQLAEWVAHGEGTDPALLDLVRRDAERAGPDLSDGVLAAAARQGARCVVIAPAQAHPGVSAALDAAGAATEWID